MICASRACSVGPVPAAASALLETQQCPAQREVCVTVVRCRMGGGNGCAGVGHRAPPLHSASFPVSSPRPSLLGGRTGNLIDAIHIPATELGELSATEVCPRKREKILGKSGRLLRSKTSLPILRDVSIHHTSLSIPYYSTRSPTGPFDGAPLRLLPLVPPPFPSTVAHFAIVARHRQPVVAGRSPPPFPSPSCSPS